MFTCVLLQSYRYSNPSEGTDRVAGQLREDKECPFSGVRKSGRVWRKVPESGGARSVHTKLTLEKIILPRLERATFRSRVRHPATRLHPASMMMMMMMMITIIIIGSERAKWQYISLFIAVV